MRRILYLRQCVRCTSCASSDRRARKRSLGGVVTWIRDNDSVGSYCRISPVQELHNLSEQRMRISRSSFESFSGSFMSSPQIIGLRAWFSSPSIERVISATVPEGIDRAYRHDERFGKSLVAGSPNSSVRTSESRRMSSSSYIPDLCSTSSASRQGSIMCV